MGYLYYCLHYTLLALLCPTILYPHHIHYLLLPVLRDVPHTTIPATAFYGLLYLQPIFTTVLATFPMPTVVITDCHPSCHHALILPRYLLPPTYAPPHTAHVSVVHVYFILPPPPTLPDVPYVVPTEPYTVGDDIPIVHLFSPPYRSPHLPTFPFYLLPPTCCSFPTRWTEPPLCCCAFFYLVCSG